ncbi:unnamed protein product [Withania somnifera]
MDNKEEVSKLPIEGGANEPKAINSEEIAKEEIKNDQVMIDAPKIVTIESDANRGAEQVKEENTNMPSEGNVKNEQVEKEEKDKIASPELEFTIKVDQIKQETKCRPIAFLLGLPFALISLVIAFIGGLIWIIGLMLTCICPCCFCVTGLATVLAEMALGLVNAPFQFFQYITDKIPF